VRPELTGVAERSVDWMAATDEVAIATDALRSASNRFERADAWDRLLRAGDTCTELIHGWLASQLEMEPVREPRTLLSLDVDGVLEDDLGFCSATGLLGAAALKLLQIGRVGVVLNTARSMRGVQARVASFHLLGGVAGFGSATWDAVYGRETHLGSDAGIDQLSDVHAELSRDEATVFDRDHDLCVRASRIVGGVPVAIENTAAHELLNRRGLNRLMFWVAPSYTDFVERGVDKGKGLQHLQRQLGVTATPLAAMGDSSCDLPMLRKAQLAFIPASTLTSYIAPRGQRLMRSRFTGQRALWEAAKSLVPDGRMQAEVEARLEVIPPEWFPAQLREATANKQGIGSHVAAVLRSRPRRIGIG
jgi:haloacid dehalogenase-like hydrolase